MSINQNINTKELLNMFWAAWHIQENIMYVKPDNKYLYGHYKKHYMKILNEITDLHKDISKTLEGKVFKLGVRWSNDLFDIIEELIIKEYEELTEETKVSYFDENVKKYVNEYIRLDNMK